MKLTTLASVALAACLFAGGCSTDKAEKSEKKSSGEAALMSQAKVSKATAEQTALAKVPGGTIKEGELEKEHGKLIWSFDISTPNSRDIQEVHVDAVTGEVIAVETETPADQAKENAEDAKKQVEDALKK